MGFLIKKQKGVIFTGIAKLSVVTLISSLAFAFTDTIWAVYLKDFLVSDSKVGFFSAFLTLISFISFFLIIPLIERSNKSKLYSSSLLLIAISFFLFSINKKFLFFVFLAIFVSVLQTIRITSFGIIVEDKSSKKRLSRNEGIMYSFTNFAWVIGPLIAGTISSFYGINSVFILSSVVLIFSYVFFRKTHIIDNKKSKKIDSNLLKNFKDFFKSKDRLIAYVLGGGVNYWWSLIYLFIPLFIIENGLGIEWIGYFFFAIAIPTTILPYKFGKLAGRIGFKKMFRIGFFIPFLLALICFFVGNVYIVLALLILAIVGLAMLESTTEAYFFDILKGKEDLRFYGPYNTTIDANHFVGRAISAVILLFLPFKFLFLFFSLSMFICFVISSKTRNIVEMRR